MVLDNPHFVVLFKNTEVISDIEENQNTTQPPKRIKPIWRSKAFTKCCHLLDECTKQMASSKTDLKSNNKYYKREGEASGIFNGLQNVPLGLPKDAYCKEFTSTLTVVEKTALKMEGECNFDGIIKTIEKYVGPGNNSSLNSSTGGCTLGESSRMHNNQNTDDRGPMHLDV